MSIADYQVPNDFFDCEQLSDHGLDFPCCVCAHKKNSHGDLPCKYCGHNDSAQECHYCPLCGELQDGSARDGFSIAKDTPAEIRGLCWSCYGVIEQQFEVY
jgi:hypothetical protein